MLFFFYIVKKKKMFFLNYYHTFIFLEMPVSLLQPETKSFPKMRTFQFRPLIWKKSSCLQPDIWLVCPESAGQSNHTVIHHLLMLGRKLTHWFFSSIFFLPPKQFESECTALTNYFISRLMDIFLAPDWPWLCTELHQSEGVAAERAAPSQTWL